MGAKTWFYANAQCNALVGRTNDINLDLVALDGGIWLALYTAMPTVAGALGTEVAAGDYARFEISTSYGTSTYFEDDAVDGVIASTQIIQWDIALDDWGSIIGAALVGVSGGADYIFRIMELSVPKTITAGMRVKFEPGAQVFSES